MSKQIDKFNTRAVNAFKNGCRSYPDRLDTMMNAISRIQSLHTRIASEESKENAIMQIWTMFNTLHQRMVVEQSIYMDGMQRDMMSHTCMISLNETDTDNLEREQLYKPAELMDETSYDVVHVAELSPPALLFNMGGEVAYRDKVDAVDYRAQRYGKPEHQWFVTSAFWKGIPYRAN